MAHAEAEDELANVAIHKVNKKGKKAADVRRVQSDSPPSPSKQLAADAGEATVADSSLMMHPATGHNDIAVNMLVRAGSAEPMIPAFALKIQRTCTQSPMCQLATTLACQRLAEWLDQEGQEVKGYTGLRHRPAAFKVFDLPCKTLSA